MIRKYWQKYIEYILEKLGYKIDRRSFSTRQNLDLIFYCGLNVFALLFTILGFNIIGSFFIILSLTAMIYVIIN